ncbi:hypothetical protein [Pleomorphochaeta sp. DL1XJH-081]|uniref:hypothetical protein n=1 Tax=Pleomorphochaeta sp. DL1XJH-081 TaxID=3409690 RepID=UPI003BB7035F
MLKKLIYVVCIMLVTLGSLPGGSFQQYEASTVAGDDFNFPTDALDNKPVLFALAMGTTRESGEIQQKHLLRWDSEIKVRNTPLKTLAFYHFPIIEAPRFIHGVIRRGIGKSYKDIVLEELAAVIFIKDTETFAEQAGIPLDDQATVVLVLPDNTIAGYVKGPFSLESMGKLEQLYDRFINR